MTTYNTFEPLHSDPESLLADPPLEGIVLHTGEVVTSAFLAKDGLVRTWLKQSVKQKDMTPEEAKRIYGQWNPDPEFDTSSLLD